MAGVNVPGQQLHITDAAALVPEIAPVRNRRAKPHGGFWTSTYLDGKSAWVDAHQGLLTDLRGSAFTLNWFLLTVDPAARILMVDSLADLKRLLGKYPFTSAGGLPYLDFEAISQHYDAMNLTSQGEQATRFTEPSWLSGWDSESTLWFRWRFTAVRQISPPKVQ